MTIDETGNPIETKMETANVTNDLIRLEDTDMVRSWGTKFVNMMVEASDLAKRVAVLQEELSKITNALTVANENAARAIAERDAAFRERDRANELREQAEHAYQNVNEQRVNVARELHDTLETLQVVKTDQGWLKTQLEEARLERDLHREESEKLKQDVFNATNSAASMVDAVKAERDAVISALRMEVQALKDERFQLRNELDTNALDVSMLRKIISEAKLAAAGVQGVLEGTLAAE